MTSTSLTTPVVFVKDNTVFANSRDVAEYFGKEHKNVLRDTDLIRHEIPRLKSELWFRPIMGEHPTVPGRTIRSFDMTRDGFMLLVMGYTGKKAMAAKVQYIDRFNEMAEELKRLTTAQALPDFNNPVIAARAWADAKEETLRLEAAKHEAEERVKKLEPKSPSP